MAMRIAQRMYLALLPALLGVVTVGALAYWGQYEHEAPVWFVVVVAIATIGSLIVAWLNARYVTRRIERLAARGILDPNAHTLLVPNSVRSKQQAQEWIAMANDDLSRRVESGAWENKEGLSGLVSPAYML